MKQRMFQGPSLPGPMGYDVGETGVMLGVYFHDLHLFCALLPQKKLFSVQGNDHKKCLVLKQYSPSLSPKYLVLILLIILLKNIETLMVLV
jgi:hypothetical protein